jgi:hypothetical protein
MIFHLLEILTKNEISSKPSSQHTVWRNGGSIPQTILCKFGRYYPAESSVEAATAPSRWDVICKRRTAQQQDNKMRKLKLDY